jgi:hypothetical protein
VTFLLLWLSDINIYVVNTGALFFFSLGYYIVKYNISHKHIDNIKIIDISCAYGVIIVLKLFLPGHVNIIGQINIIVAVLFVIKASAYLINNEKLYGCLNWLKEHTFFIYASHMVLETALAKLSVLIMPVKGGWILAQYFGASIITIAILVITGILIKKTVPQLYGILTGGRI